MKKDLTAEIARLRRNWTPAREDLEGVPVLSSWRFGFHPLIRALCLYGDVTGHPVLPDQPIHTSALVAIDEAAGWARTVNRYYCLR